MRERMATSGYLIEKTFAHVCRKSQISPGLNQSTVLNRPAQYRGLQREPLLGYEPSEFYPPTCYSPIANSLFFPVFPELKPPCEQEPQLGKHYDKLNESGLFGTQTEAEEYLKAFFALLPDEQHYAYYMTEVRAVAG